MWKKENPPYLEVRHGPARLRRGQQLPEQANVVPKLLVQALLGPELGGRGRRRGRRGSFLVRGHGAPGWGGVPVIRRHGAHDPGGGTIVQPFCGYCENIFCVFGCAFSFIRWCM